MDDLSRLHTLNRVEEITEQRAIEFHPVSGNMHDYDAEIQLLQVVFVFKTFVDGYKNVTLALGLRNQLGVGEGTPIGLCDGHDFMIGEGLVETRIYTLV